MGRPRKPAVDAINFAKVAADIHSNPKVRRAGRNGRDVFIFVLCRVALAKAQGRISVSNVDTFYLAEQLQMSEEEAEEGLSRCLARPRPDQRPLLEIAGGNVIVCGWNDEWGRYPMTEAERKRLERAKKSDDAADDVTFCPDTSGHVTPGPDCHGSDQIRSENSPSPDSLGSPPEADPRADVRADLGAPLPEPPEGLALGMATGWKPQPEPLLESAAEALGVDVAGEFVKLRNRQEQHADWQARWREWLGRAIDWARKQPTPTRAPARAATPARRREPDPDLERIAEKAKLAAAERDAVATELEAAMRGFVDGFANFPHAIARAARDRERPEQQRAELDLPAVRRAAKAAPTNPDSDPEEATG